MTHGKKVAEGALRQLGHSAKSERLLSPRGVSRKLTRRKRRRLEIGWRESPSLSWVRFVRQNIDEQEAHHRDTRKVVMPIRTPENRGGGLLGRLGKKFRHEILGIRRNVRIGTDLESAKICSDRLKISHSIPPCRYFENLLHLT